MLRLRRCRHPTTGPTTGPSRGPTIDGPVGTTTTYDDDRYKYRDGYGYKKKKRSSLLGEIFDF